MLYTRTSGENQQAVALKHLAYCHDKEGIKRAYLKFWNIQVAWES
jgi:hypothetical protein